MTEREFEVLAAKVLGGEATAEENARLRAILDGDSALRADFEEMQAAWSVIRESASAIDAMEAAPKRPPANRVEQWQAAVAERRLSETQPSRLVEPAAHDCVIDARPWFGQHQRTLLAAAAVLATIVAISALLVSERSGTGADAVRVGYLLASTGTIEILRSETVVRVSAPTAVRASDVVRLAAEASGALLTTTGATLLHGPATLSLRSLNSDIGASAGRSANHSNLLNLALFSNPTSSLPLLVTTRSGLPIPIYSPIGFTRNPRPVLLWKEGPGKRYDVVLRDELSLNAPAWRATNVTPPLAFALAWPNRELDRDGLYRLTLLERGSGPASEVTFRVLAADRTRENNPGPPLIQVYSMMSSDPPLFGDALALLNSLPAEVRESELGLRLKLFAVGRLGYHDDYHEILARLQGRAD